MTDEERTACNAFIKDYIERKQAQGEWDADPVGLMRVAYAGACEANRRLNEEMSSELSQQMNRSAKLQEENEKLRYDAQKIYADYMDRGAAMRDTGDLVRSLYIPKLEAERARSAKLIECMRRYAPSIADIRRHIAEYEASRD